MWPKIHYLSLWTVPQGCEDGLIAGWPSLESRARLHDVAHWSFGSRRVNVVSMPSACTADPRALTCVTTAESRYASLSTERHPLQERPLRTIARRTKQTLQYVPVYSRGEVRSEKIDSRTSNQPASYN